MLGTIVPWMRRAKEKEEEEEEEEEASFGSWACAQ